MSRIRRMTASLGAASLISAGLAGMSSGAAHAASGPAVSVTETTTNQSQLLAPQSGATFAPGSSSQGQVITVNPSTTYQSMTGFGASFTDSSAWLVDNSPLRSQIMTKLFDPSQGIGLDFLRQPIGASDFSLSTYSYDDMPSGQTDPTLANFSIAHDQAYIIPVLQQALSLNPAITVMATPWSPPGWMKTSGSMVGGTLNSGDYQVFADYLTKFIQAYDAAGVPISLITPQNEPEYSPSNYPGSTLTASQEASFIGNNLGPDLQRAGLSTKIIGYDHNWNDTSFPETVLGDSTAGQYTAGVAWHCYSGDPSAQTTVHNAYPNKDTYFTECSGSQSSNPANTFSDSLDWQTENLIIGATRNWAKSVVTWNMALNPSGGPSMNCTTCTGVVTVDNSAGTATYNAEYYVLGQASKFVKPGAVRIDSNTFGSGNIEDVAFQNPNGSDALVVLNSNTSSANTFGVDENGQYFNYTLPAGAVATFTWTPGSTSTGSLSAPSNLSSSEHDQQRHHAELGRLDRRVGNHHLRHRPQRHPGRHHHRDQLHRHRPEPLHRLHLHRHRHRHGGRHLAGLQRRLGHHPGIRRRRRRHQLGHLVPGRQHQQRQVRGRHRRQRRQRHRRSAVGMRQRQRQPGMAVPAHQRRLLPGRHPQQHQPGLGRHRRSVRHRERHPDPAVERCRRHQPAVAAHPAVKRRLHLHRPQQRQRMPGRHQPLDIQRHAAPAVGLHRRRHRPDIPARPRVLTPSAGRGRRRPRPA